MIAIIIVAALLALVQIAAERAGSESPLTTAGMTLATFLESATSATINGARSAVSSVAALPTLERDNASLRSQNIALTQENARLHELAAEYASSAALQPIVVANPRGIEARVIGFPPENESRTITIDRGSSSGIHKDDGVLGTRGIVGRIASVTPFSSQVVLITDYTSRFPAITQRGRYSGIARGNLSSVRVEYIPQDAPVKVGDVVVTGAGRSFRSGFPIGTITSIERSDTTLYQTAVLKTAVDLDSLDRVVVVPQ